MLHSALGSGIAPAASDSPPADADGRQGGYKQAGRSPQGEEEESRDRGKGKWIGIGFSLVYLRRGTMQLNKYTKMPE